MKFYWNTKEGCVLSEFPKAIEAFCDFFSETHQWGLKGRVGEKEVRLNFRKDLLPQLPDVAKAIEERNISWLQAWFAKVWLILSPRSSVLLFVPKVKENKGIFLFSESGLFYPMPLYQKVASEEGRIRAVFSVLYFRVGVTYMQMNEQKVAFWYYKGAERLTKINFEKATLEEILDETSVK